MRPVRTELRCAICQASLTRWNEHTCTKCGKHLCPHHAHHLRLPHSYVLSSLCDNCSAHEHYAFPKMSAATKTSAPPPTT